MKFRVLTKTSRPPDSGISKVYLRIDHWNDYSFVTMFHLSLHDEQGQYHDVGETKIGFRGQTIAENTYTKLPESFDALSDEFFSLGQSTEFYRKLAEFRTPLRNQILSSLRDIVFMPEIIDGLKDEKVLGISLLRGMSLSVVKGQFARVLDGRAELTDFHFKFVRQPSDKMGGVALSFKVGVGTMPITNIHAIIGRNGVGKTTLLNGMVRAVTSRSEEEKFVDTEGWGEKEIASDYFSSLVSVSFSAFEPFIPPKDQPDPAKGTCYFYVGLKDSNAERHRTIDELHRDCARALTECFRNDKKTERWRSAIEKLCSDENFASMRMGRLETVYRDIRNQLRVEEQSDSNVLLDRYYEAIAMFLSKMSSGHAIVLLTVTRLVELWKRRRLCCSMSQKVTSIPRSYQRSFARWRICSMIEMDWPSLRRTRPSSCKRYHGRAFGSCIASARM